MLRRLVFVLIAGFVLSACSGGGSSEPSRQRSCDDGGSGGVLIDGVCL